LNRPALEIVPAFVVHVTAELFALLTVATNCSVAAEVRFRVGAEIEILTALALDGLVPPKENPLHDVARLTSKRTKMAAQKF
jgi:hypothetical protein